MQKWIKKGRIFDPKKFGSLYTYASVPIADRISDNLYRIFFSGRDEHNRSFTSFFEINIKDLKNPNCSSNQTILQPGDLGTFDESGAMGSCIVSEGLRKYLYYIGWNIGVTVPFRNSIGLAVSDNGGRTFKKYSEGPILDRGIYDPCFTASSYVLKENDIWRMWYLSCTKWEKINENYVHFYHIKYAESNDGIHWQRKGIICIDFKSDDEYAISRPCVIKDNNIYKMWYSYRGESYRIGYAVSKDGLIWERKDEEIDLDVSETGWDSEMICYQYIFDHKGERYMLYNGNGYGKTGIGLAVLSKE